jgi:hypothetical protein
MRKAVAEKIADEVAEWGHSGLIDADLQAVLNSRYASEITLGHIFVRWLGFIALMLLAASVLGFIGTMVGEAAAYLAPPILGGAAFILWQKGTAMAVDPTQRYATSGAVLVTFSLFVGFAAMMIFYGLAGGDSNRFAVPVMMLVVSAAALLTAYRFGLRWPLLVGILMAFHALGHMHSYGGRGSYFMGIADERITLVAAVISILVGMWHERAVETQEKKLTGFGHVFIVFGLLYANMSLWFLSLPRGKLLAVMIFAAASVAQLVAGGRFHDGRFVGFGIVFLAINLYTRMFESFWNEMSKGTFLLLAGSAAMVVGVFFERRARNLRAEAQE